jgi:O-antigen/teichoic acid export membrane protein
VTASLVPPRGANPTVILVSTVIVGLLGFALTFLVARELGAADYSRFAVYWAGTFFATGLLVGFQQEIARATHPVSPGAHPATRLPSFAAASFLVVVVLAAGTAPFWSTALFPGSDSLALAVPLIFGAASYTIVAIVTGALFGVSALREVAAFALVDAVLRFLFVLVLLAFTTDAVVLAWAVATPFLLTPLILLARVRRRLTHRVVLDVSIGRLSSHVLQSLVGSASTAALVSGFPIFVVATSADEPARLVGSFVLVLTLVRSPLIVVFMAMQSVLVVRFRALGRGSTGLALRLLGALAGGTVLLGLAAALLGPEVLPWALGRDYVVPGVTLGALVASSGVMAGLCITGPLAIARSQHAVYSAGWVVAAVAALSILFLPLSFEARIVTALLASPAVGMAVHAIGLFLTRRAPRRSVETA